LPQDVERLERAVDELEQQVFRLQRINRQPEQVQTVNVYMVRPIDRADPETSDIAELVPMPAESPESRIYCGPSSIRPLGIMRQFGR
jgi:hypothetical protein